jgi:hypothetical protein
MVVPKQLKEVKEVPSSYTDETSAIQIGGERVL